jgi:hypothetical protein
MTQSESVFQLCDLCVRQREALTSDIIDATLERAVQLVDNLVQFKAMPIENGYKFLAAVSTGCYWSSFLANQFAESGTTPLQPNHLYHLAQRICSMAIESNLLPGASDTREALELLAPFLIDDQARLNSDKGQMIG